ncbi:MAG TPA: diaminopimelate epimerase [Bacteroidales bacterium]|nr:diaminopimelate epimerase [Bacteroidales bacterium]
MIVEFSKYQGAGNDFIIIDCRNNEIKLTEEQIKLLCDRRFGIGADGMMTIYDSLLADFAMKYYNSNGKEASMCGNGGRCIAKYAVDNNIAKTRMVFSAFDGLHSAFVSDEKIQLSMADVKDIHTFEDGFFLNTGSPHFVKIVDDINKVNVRTEGLKLANDKRFAPERTNVNFIDIENNTIRIATYERGVEDETLACGTGAVAAAIVAIKHKYTNITPVKLLAKGGTLFVNFIKLDDTFTNIVLIGPAEFVFSGKFDLQ